MSFSVGDKAVHPAHGVGEITQIEERLIGSDKIDFYILKLLNGKSGTIRVALNAVDRVGLRQVMSRSAAKTVLAELKKDEMAVTSQPWNRRYREYTEMLKSGSPIKVAKVLRDLSKVRADKGELQLRRKEAHGASPQAPHHRASPSPPRPRRNNRARPRSHPQLKKGTVPFF